MTRLLVFASLIALGCGGKKAPESAAPPEPPPVPEAPAMADADSEADSEAAIVYLEDASALVDTRWELQSFNGEPLVTTADTKPVFFRVDSGQPPSLVGFGGCNRFYGTGFTATAETVAFGSVGSTRMACPNLGSEQIFIATLSKADRWLVESDSLTVMAGADATLVFGRVTNVVDEDVDQP